MGISQSCGDNFVIESNEDGLLHMLSNEDAIWEWKITRWNNYAQESYR